MTLKEAQAFCTWATNKATAEGLGIATGIHNKTASAPQRVTVSVYKPVAKMQCSVTIEVPFHWTRDEAQAAYHAAVKKLEMRVAKVIK
jgi:hypothetical protein